MVKLPFVLLTAFAVLSLANSKRYDNYQVHRVTPKTKEQLQVLQKLNENENYHFWTAPAALGRSVDIMVPPHLKRHFQDFLNVQGLNGELLITNVQERIENEKRKASTPTTPLEHDWKEYQTLEDLYAWLDGLVKKYPKILEPIIGGQSYEGRQIKGVKLSYGKGRKSVFIEGGIHANEWISPATVTFILNQLLTSKNRAVRAVARSRDWYVFPSFNPDGYVYSHTTDRLWRKNRRPSKPCSGVDLNRNWDYHWMDGGASNDTCSKYHAGTAPFSEIESRTMSKFIDHVADSIDVYLAFHSYAQFILSPFGHQSIEVPDNDDDHKRIGKAAAKSLAVRYGTHYLVGNSRELLYVTSGTSVDWVLGKHRNIRIVYTVELRDRGRHGFLLPPEQIIPTGEETLDAVVKIIQEVDQLHSVNNSRNIV